VSNVALYLAAVLIWGSTWLVIKFQLGTVPAIVSVAWRFALASLILLLYAGGLRRPVHFALRHHPWIALQGILMFGLNYIGVYLAEQSLVSGLVAVVFSLTVFGNAIGMRVCFGTPIRASAFPAAMLGVTGVALIFGRELLSMRTAGAKELQGLLTAVAATVFASLGNMVAMRNYRQGLPIIQLNAWSMLYGALFVLVVALALREPLAFEPSFSYVASLLYLALFGSALAFGAYVTLMVRIGPDRAAYTAVAIPIVALLLSTLFEGLRWHIETVTGVMACVGGTALALRRRAA
jgi:drug/metabolite transporter (DMT)-like permease